MHLQKSSLYFHINLFEVNSLQHHFREQRTCRELIRELIWESLSFEEIITYISHRVLFVQVWDTEEREKVFAQKKVLKLNSSLFRRRQQYHNDGVELHYEMKIPITTLNLCSKAQML